ncbi:MAG: Asp-tRNA(Asn)/Glu-tRNA(Gln) amidotransferase subunit GatC [Candidatus Lokiarchaeota archaeon]|nr:Asp-tRNA(Asn)/Glu-tRNA(Gln) amidotransferase subunit GatC [Candidatus Lokiarchaeota archaeon]
MAKKDDFSKENLDYLSKLALINLTEEEKERLAQELGDILEYFNKLNELETTDVEPLTHPIEGLKNIFREDIPTKSLSNEETLKNAKHTKDGFFKAPKIIKD